MGGVFGHGEWGIGHGEEVTCLAYAPSGALSNLVHPLLGLGPATFLLTTKLEFLVGVQKRRLFIRFFVQNT
ncbi:hypothetical protein [Nostoc sp.]|uniref:hypothetical protein n=1 Tax=Nostoc sp. TaxID=1180 RepID=UPI002FF84A92